MNDHVGFHVSIAGGVSNSVDNALKIGSRAFQIFSRNPRGWSAKPLAENDIKMFKTKLSGSGIGSKSVIVHMPYLPNLAAPDSEFYKKSIDAFAEELQRCNTLGVAYLVIHLGSHLGRGREHGIKQLLKACNYALDNYKSKSRGDTRVQILLENMAGQKNCIGNTFEDLRLILDKLNSREFGICLDTCHAFASGYDWREEAKVEAILDNFNNIVGLKDLKVLHLNDSKGDLCSHIDRHEHIGLGRIGEAGFIALLNNRALRNLPIILETPCDEKRSDLQNLNYVMSLIRKRN